jgi:hypothetical protein
MSENSRPAFFVRIGTLMVAPGRALADIQARERGGVGDALAILLLGVLCFRLPAVARAVLMVREASLAGTLAQLLGIVGEDLRPALLIALPAGIATTILAGRGRRDPGLDIELGAACSIPYLLLSGLAELAGSQALLPGAERVLGSVIPIIAPAWALMVFVLGVRLARSRRAGEQTAGESVAPARGQAEPPRRARVAATVVGGVLAGALTLNVVWLSHNRDAIAPVGRGVVAPAFVLPRIDGTPGSVGLHELRGKVVRLHPRFTTSTAPGIRRAWSFWPSAPRARWPTSRRSKPSCASTQRPIRISSTTGRSAACTGWSRCLIWS